METSHEKYAMCASYCFSWYRDLLRNQWALAMSTVAWTRSLAQDEPVQLVASLCSKHYRYTTVFDDTNHWVLFSNIEQGEKRHFTSVHILSKDCMMSSTMSSKLSMPKLKRTKLSLIPKLALSSGP